MSAIKAINAMRNELGLEEQDYRGLLERVTGKVSLRAMSPGELGRVMDDLRAKGAGRANRLAGPYAGKLQALWISGWNLGVVRNRDDAALLAFVKAKTGIEHTRFLRNAADARKAVEALKQWLAREAGVNWSAFKDPQDCVIAAQRRLLDQADAPPATYTVSGHPSTHAAAAISAMAKVALMQHLGEQIRKRASR